MFSVRLAYGYVFWGKITEVNAMFIMPYRRYIWLMWFMTVDVDLDYLDWSRIYPDPPSTARLLFVLPFHTVLFWKEVTIYSPNFRNRAPLPLFFKGTGDIIFFCRYIHLLKVGYFVIVSKGWQGKRFLSQWKAELPVWGQKPKWRWAGFLPLWSNEVKQQDGRKLQKWVASVMVNIWQWALWWIEFSSSIWFKISS